MSKKFDIYSEKIVDFAKMMRLIVNTIWIIFIVDLIYLAIIGFCYIFSISCPVDMNYIKLIIGLITLLIIQFIAYTITKTRLSIMLDKLKNID